MLRFLRYFVTIVFSNLHIMYKRVEPGGICRWSFRPLTSACTACLDTAVYIWVYGTEQNNCFLSPSFSQDLSGRLFPSVGVDVASLSFPARVKFFLLQHHDRT